MKKILIIFLALFFSNQSFAANWQIDSSKSKIEFIAIQNSSPVNGSFANFSGSINFDKNNLTKSDVNILIDLSSVRASLSEAPAVLKTDGWFNVKNFPNAEFKSQKFTKISENKFGVQGFLTIRGKKLPLNFDFVFDKYSSAEAIAKGELKLNRLDFGIGKKDENQIKDLVTVKFLIVAKK